MLDRHSPDGEVEDSASGALEAAHSETKPFLQKVWNCVYIARYIFTSSSMATVDTQMSDQMHSNFQAHEKSRDGTACAPRQHMARFRLRLSSGICSSLCSLSNHVVCHNSWGVKQAYNVPVAMMAMFDTINDSDIYRQTPQSGGLWDDQIFRTGPQKPLRRGMRARLKLQANETENLSKAAARHDHSRLVQLNARLQSKCELDISHCEGPCRVIGPHNSPGDQQIRYRRRSLPDGDSRNSSRGAGISTNRAIRHQTHQAALYNTL